MSVVSTWLYLECLDHSPVLVSEGAVGQHLYDLPRIRGEIARREEFLKPFHDGGGYGHNFLLNSALFLVQHPRCNVGIRDEYGHEHPIGRERRGRRWRIGRSKKGQLLKL